MVRNKNGELFYIKKADGKHSSKRSGTSDLEKKKGIMEL